MPGKDSSTGRTSPLGKPIKDVRLRASMKVSDLIKEMEGIGGFSAQHMVDENEERPGRARQAEESNGHNYSHTKRQASYL